MQSIPPKNKGNLSRKNTELIETKGDFLGEDEFENGFLFRQHKIL